MPFIVFGKRLFVRLDRYSDNGRLAVKLEEVDGSSFAVLSVNLPALACPNGHFWAKTWSENSSLRAPALASGMFEDTGARARTGFVQAELWRLK